MEPTPGSLWVMEVPTPNGQIGFRADSNATAGPLAFTSTVGCLELVAAPLGVTVYPLGLSSVNVVTGATSPAVTERSL